MASTAPRGTLRYVLWSLWQGRKSHASPQKIQRLQDGRLRQLLRTAAQHSSFYRDKFAGINLEHCQISDLPVTTKEELMDHFDDTVTDPGVHRDDVERFIADPNNSSKLFMDKYAVCHTSGSSGRSLLVLQDQLMLELLFAFQMTRGNAVSKLTPREILRRIMHPVRLAGISPYPHFNTQSSVWEHMPAPVRNFLKVRHFVSTNPNLIAELNAYNPNVLVGYVNLIESLANNKDEIHFPDLRQVVCTSENLSAASRGRLREVFNAPVMNNYSCGECAILSNSCRTDSGVHVNADWVIVEVVDEQYRPVAPGVLGDRVLLTNLSNTVQPFIRYEIGDRVQWAATPCSCGNRLPRIDRIEGRTADYFPIRVDGKDIRLLGLNFKYALDHARHVREWQVVELAPNRLLVRIELLPGATWNETEICDLVSGELQRLGVAHALTLTYEHVRRVAADRLTGKLRRVVRRQQRAA